MIEFGLFLLWMFAIGVVWIMQEVHDDEMEKVEEHAIEIAKQALGIGQSEDSAMDKLTIEETDAIKKALLSRAFQMLIGAEEWDLSEEEEVQLWSAIRKMEALS